VKLAKNSIILLTSDQNGKDMSTSTSG